MSFLNPLGLLGLLAIPVLIVVYIIKNKYVEQVVPSTYLWNLSNRFLKKKNPLNKINGLLSLILQILAVIFISFAVAQPTFTLYGAANDYLFVLDASGSMQMEQEGVTRFERGKDEIKSLINGAANGSTYTLVCEGNTTDRIYENLTDKRAAISLLENLEAGYSASSQSLVGAQGVAQEYFSANTSLQIYLITDKAYETTQNIHLINLWNGEFNYAVSDVAYERDGENLLVTGNAWSYSSDAQLTLSLYLNGEQTAEQTKVCDVAKLQATPFSFTCARTEFTSVKVVVEEEDNLPADNQSIVYNLKGDTRYKSLVVTDGSPLFWESAISSLGNINVDVMTSAEYEQSQETYGLYVFDSYTPRALPRESAVWFINPQLSLNDLNNVGFTVSELEDFGNDLEGEQIDNWTQLAYSTSSASAVRELLADTVGSEISIAAYRRIETVRSFHELMYCNNDPVLFAGTNGYGNRQAVFAFDIHDSDMAVSYDFPVLVHNLLNYTFPDIIEQSSYTCGETMKINVLPGCNSIRVQSPSGKISYPNVNTDVVEYEITEAGVYQITVTSGQTETSLNVYGNLPMQERFPNVKEVEFTVLGEATEQGRDGVYDDLLILFILLAVIFILDWGVYCYEQYQLR